MQQYHDLLTHILRCGIDRSDRTGVGTKSIFGHQMRFNLAAGFPLITSKKLNLNAIIHELLWFISGDTTLGYLHKHNVHIWDPWADSGGSLGRIYGAQWRTWRASDGRTVDQLSNVVHSIKSDPYSRRHVVVAYNPGELEEMALPPCHALFQFYVANSRLSCQLYQRSGDVFIGVPFNIASYALLTLMLAQVTGYKPGDFIHTLGDAHLYLNHVELARLQLTRRLHPLPQMILNSERSSLFDFVYDDFQLVNYIADPHIKAEIAV